MNSANYHLTITNLFDMLSQANLADTEFKAWWQTLSDADGHGYYGHIRKAIVEIAGEKIVRHWEDTNEVCLDLASRNSWR